MEPVRLRSFEITRAVFVPFAFRYRLWPGVALAEGVALLIGLGFGVCLGPTVGVAVAIVGTYLIASVVIGRFQNLKKVVADPLNRSAFEQRTFVFDDEELRMTTVRNTRSQIPFANLVRIEEHPDRFLVYLSNIQSFLILKSAFVTAEDIERFRRVARSHGRMK